MKNQEVHKTSIGGQAVLEGVMMRGPKDIAVAVRKSDGEIVVDKKPVSSITAKYPFLKWPIIRGVVNFIESMILGVKTLMFSAELYDTGEEMCIRDSYRTALHTRRVFALQASGGFLHRHFGSITQRDLPDIVISNRWLLFRYLYFLW